MSRPILPKEENQPDTAPKYIKVSSNNISGVPPTEAIPASSTHNKREVYVVTTYLSRSRSTHVHDIVETQVFSNESKARYYMENYADDLYYRLFTRKSKPQPGEAVVDDGSFITDCGDNIQMGTDVNQGIHNLAPWGLVTIETVMFNSKIREYR